MIIIIIIITERHVRRRVCQLLLCCFLQRMKMLFWTLSHTKQVDVPHTGNIYIFLTMPATSMWCESQSVPRRKALPGSQQNYNCPYESARCSARKCLHQKQPPALCRCLLYLHLPGDAAFISHLDAASNPRGNYPCVSEEAIRVGSFDNPSSPPLFLSINQRRRRVESGVRHVAT